ncbi:MAG TPA: peptidylprolyl isomerase [Candidatus Angelobacter sp.]|nr:peptidylprolyl isomerase [Candidatus Angelobacter sp.]
MLQRSALIFLLFTIVVSAACQTANTPAAKPAAQGHGATHKAPAAPAGPPTAILHTTAGDLKCELFPDKAPKTVANFIGLSNGTKEWTNPTTNKVEHHHALYDGVIFHRVIPDFMIQGGDPAGNGSGEPGYTLKDELLPDLLFDQPGRLAMANRGPNTAGSQFFITEKVTPFLNPCLTDGGCPALQRPKDTGYTIFGQCDDLSVELVKKIARMPCAGNVTCTVNNSSPVNPVKITHIEILNAGKAAAAPHKSTGAAAPIKPTAPRKPDAPTAQ